MNDIFEAIKNMTVGDLKELTDALKEEFDIDEVGPKFLLEGDAIAEAPVEEATEFDVILALVGPSKIKIMKEARTLLQISLKEIKDLVEDGACLLEAVDSSKAEEVKVKLEELGATVEVKPSEG